MKEEIFKRLDAIGEKLGVAAAHLYGVYIRQAITEGVTDFVIAGIALALFVVAMFVLRCGIKYEIKNNGYGSSDGDNKAGLIASGIALGVLSLAIFSIWMVSGLQNVLNPEYWAMHHLFEDLRSAVGK